MKYEYDAKTDILLIRLGRAQKPGFGAQKENIIAYYDKQGKPVEIEFLDAGKTAVKMLEAIVQGKKAEVVAR